MFVAIVAVLIFGAVARRLRRRIAQRSWPTTEGRIVDVQRRSGSNVAAAQAAGMPAGAIRTTVMLVTVSYMAPDSSMHQIQRRVAPSRLRSISPSGTVKVAVSPKSSSRAVVLWDR